MNLAALIRILGAKGMSPDAIADVIEAATPKSTGAERTRRWREKKEAEAIEAVTVTVTPVTAVTSVTKDAPAPVHTRGENNLSRLEDTGANLTTLHDASEPDLDWPGDAKPSRAYLDKLEAAVRGAGGVALDPTAAKLFTLAPILALGRAGKGPPCDLQADVLPTIRARAAKAAPQSIGGWDYFTKACEEARDRRLAGASGIRELRPSGPDPPRRQSLADQIGDERRRATELTLASLKASNG